MDVLYDSAHGGKKRQRDMGDGTVAEVISTVVGEMGSAGDGEIAAGGEPQDLFGGATPANGFAVCNPDQTEDLWFSLSGDAEAEAEGSIRLAANGGYYETPPGMKPWGPVSIVGPTTGQKFTAMKW